MPFITTVITGATSGIGRETALALAKKDHAIYMLVRNLEKGEEVKNEIISASKNKNIYVVECDLANLESVRNAADVLRSSLLGINILINNAGGIFGTREESADGHEMTFAVNHLGHFLLVQCLMPLLERGQARIINVSSEAHRYTDVKFNDLEWRSRPYSPWKAYGNAKLFNIYFTRSLATKYGTKGISSFALHPGLVNTSFGVGISGFGKFLLWLARPFMINAETGALTTIYLATAQRIDSKSGQYFKDSRPVNPSAKAVDEKGRQQLWDISMEMVGTHLV
ncbi:SDR family oxidoreductase [Mucilaginibacter achroorhodeus]|uniref:SDR family oxidoreductase n=1 Tax=Mucilaginibacter achroorhodeus TaxID=2599294 RepID=A0A563U6S2_9SPHI|nr:MULTISPECIES: SDR family oxidoreductase [Mucilaginibacter]QXV64886.1 SDR family oxidoreductase [Mucilaginibacter sp. 21P]TWR27035.1 SDR family oxidoreductase [Mucilaginibacter achroorhodeus]